MDCNRLAVGNKGARAGNAAGRLYRTATWSLALLASGAILVSCNSPKQKEADPAPAATASSPADAGVSSATVTITDADRAKAQNLFTSRCAACHGADGTGDGPAAKSLTPGPQSFHNGAWQASVSNSQIENAIMYGGAAVGKSPLMPGNPDLTAQPGVVAALRDIVRSKGPKQ